MIQPSPTLPLQGGGFFPGDTMDKEDEPMEEVSLEEIIERIDDISRERPSHKEVLAFLKDVVTEQYKTKQEIKTDPVHMDEELVKTKIEEGFPVVDKSDLKLDITQASHLFERLCDVLKRNKNVSSDVDDITDVIARKQLSLEELFKKTAAEDEEYFDKLSNRLKLKTEILLFLAKNSIKPIFEAYAHDLEGHVDQERWWRGYCPICGSKPVMAELIGTERKKFLICSCCGYEWRFKRTKCPFCENEEPRAFKYFFTEKEGRGYRVETCQKCKKYIKTVDTEELGEEVVPSVEDIGTLYLDVLAKKEGYTREVHPLGLDLGKI
jgi:FdhE protein